MPSKPFRLVRVELVDRLENQAQRGTPLLLGARGPAAQLGLGEPGHVADRMPRAGRRREQPQPGHVGLAVAARAAGGSSGVTAS